MMEFRLFLLYILISASALIQDTRTETIGHDSARVLQRVKRLDDDADAGRALQRVKRLEDDGQKALNRVRRDEEDKDTSDDTLGDVGATRDVSASHDLDNKEDMKLKKSVYNLAPSNVDVTQVLKMALTEFKPEIGKTETTEEITKRFDRHLMKIKQKWHAAMRKRMQHKYHLQKKMTKRLKHKEARDIALLKSKRKHYHKQIPNL